MKEFFVDVVSGIRETWNAMYHMHNLISLNDIPSTKTTIIGPFDINVAVVMDEDRIRLREKRKILSLFGTETVYVTSNAKFLDLLVKLRAFPNNAVARDAGYTNRFPKGFSNHNIIRYPKSNKHGYYLNLWVYNMTP